MEPCRVLVISSEQWPRALLRAQLLELGYDAIGARTPSAARRYPTAHPGRGPVRLIVVDDAAVAAARESFDQLRAKHPGARTLLLCRSSIAASAGDWSAVLTRPFTIEDVIAAVKALVPHPGTAASRGSKTRTP